jgi:hypothetical protein
VKLVGAVADELHAAVKGRIVYSANPARVRRGGVHSLALSSGLNVDFFSSISMASLTSMDS